MTIRVHDLGSPYFAMASFSASTQKSHCIVFDSRQLSTFARCPIHDGHRVEEAVIDRHEGDIGAPNLIGTVDLSTFQQIREDPMIQYQTWGEVLIYFRA